MTQRRATGALETEVLTQLWKASGPLTPAEVLEAIDDDLGYTTVLTILTRLWQKGLADREPRGKAYAYTARVTEADLTAERMATLLDKASDRRAALNRFVDRLSPRDERALRKILGDP